MVHLLPLSLLLHWSEYTSGDDIRRQGRFTGHGAFSLPSEVVMRSVCHTTQTTLVLDLPPSHLHTGVQPKHHLGACDAILDAGAWLRFEHHLGISGWTQVRSRVFNTI